MSINHPEKTETFDPEKAAQVLEDLIAVFQKHKPSVSEIIAITSNLLYSLGSSITPFYDTEQKDKGPSIEELNRLYYSEPGRLDVAFMLQGATMSTWLADWEKLVNKDTGETNEPNAVRSI